MVRSRLPAAAALIAIAAACSEHRTSTVTINPTGFVNPALAPLLGPSRDTMYLDEGVSGFRIQLVSERREPSFTVRLDDLDAHATLATYKLDPVSYARVEGDRWERQRLHGPDEPQREPTASAVELTIPATTFKHHTTYAFDLYGPDAQVIGHYEIETN